MEALNQRWPRRNPAHYVRKLLVVYNAACAASFNTDVEASCRKSICRRYRDSKERIKKTWLLNSTVDWLHAETPNITRHCEAKSAVGSQSRPTFAAQQATTMERPLFEACRWPGANAASLLFAAHGNKREHPRLLLTHIWSQGDLEAKVFSCQVDATRWIFFGSRVRAAGVQVQVRVAVSERAVRVRTSRRSVVFDLSNVDSVATFFRLLDTTATIIGLTCFTSCSTARASFSTAHSLPLAVPAAPGSGETLRGAHPSVLPTPSSLPPPMAFPAAGRAGPVGHPRHPPRQLGFANFASSRGASFKPSARQRAPATQSVGRQLSSAMTAEAVPEAASQPAASIVSQLSRSRSVFLTGAEGTGKTTLLKEVVPQLRVLDRSMGVCATTGMVASLMGGVTLHSWAGLRPATTAALMGGTSASELVSLLPPRARARLSSARFLVLDEISMLKAALLDGVDGICRLLRRHPNAPLGGLVVLFCGDFVQFPPVSGQGMFSGTYAFRAEVWPAMFADQGVLLRVNFRQGADSRFLGLLHRMRRAELSQDEVQMLNSRVRRSTPADVVTLFSENEQARKHNAERLDQLTTPVVEYYAVDDYKPLDQEQGVALLAAVTAAQLMVTLRVGAVVVLLSNQYFHVHGLCAGSLGVVVGLHVAYDATLRREERLPVVEFARTGARGSMRVHILPQNFEAASVQGKGVMAAAVRRQVSRLGPLNSQGSRTHSGPRRVVFALGLHFRYGIRCVLARSAP